MSGAVVVEYSNGEIVPANAGGAVMNPRLMSARNRCKSSIDPRSHLARRLSCHTEQCLPVLFFEVVLKRERKHRNERCRTCAHKTVEVSRITEVCQDRHEECEPESPDQS